MPLSVARWIGFVQESHGDKKNHVPPAALLAVQTIYCLSGAFNVTLFLLTRPNLLLFKREPEVTEVLAGDKPPRYEGETDSIEARVRHDELVINHADIYYQGESGYRIY